MESKEVKRLMEAYYSIYEGKEEPEMEEREESEEDEHKGKKKGKKEKEEMSEKEDTEDEKEMKEGVSYSAKKARAGKDIGKPGKMFGKIAKEAGERYGSEERGKKVAGAVLAKLREGTDLFDYILEHLVAEGYADTNQAALAIMANMSEEWKQSIVESAVAQRAAAVVDDQRRGSYGMADDLNKTRKSLDKLKPYPNGFPNAAGVKGV